MWHKTRQLCPDCASRGKFNFLWESRDKFFCIKFVTCSFGVYKTAVKP